MKPIRCFFGFHLYKVLRPLLIGGELIECIRCQIKLCIHHGRQKVIPFDADIQKVEKQLQELVRKYS